MSLFLSRDELARTDVVWLGRWQSYVYVLSCGTREDPDAYRPCKIGMSKDPWARAVHQRSVIGIWSLVQVEFVQPCRDAAKVERRAHEILSAKHVGREWFDCTIEEAEGAVMEAFQEVET